MKALFPLLGALLILAGCATSSTTPVVITTPHPDPQNVGVGSLALIDPIMHDNVTIIPVIRTDEKKPMPDEYITLAEAKKNGWVEITEIPGNEEVNRLTVHNNGPKPLMLLGGELLLGGKQDRIVAKDTIIPAGGKMDVPVFCVEHGRWSDQYKHFDAGDTTVPQSVREKASFADQGQVWNGVADYNKKAGASPDVSSVQGGLMLPEVQRQIDSGIASVQGALDANDKIVGMVCLVNGRIVSLELFGSNSLFKAQAPSLLRGFFADGAVGDKIANGSPDMPAVAKFVSDALSGERRQRSVAGASSQWAMDGAINGLETTSSDAKVASPQSGDGFIHGTYAPKEGN